MTDDYQQTILCIHKNIEKKAVWFRDYNEPLFIFANQIPNYITELVFQDTNLLYLEIPDTVEIVRINNVPLNYINITTCLKTLQILNCNNITELIIPDTLLYLSIYNNKSLKILSINNTSNLLFLWVVFSNIGKITIPSRVTNIDFVCNPLLEINYTSLTELNRLHIKKCPNINEITIPKTLVDFTIDIPFVYDKVV